MKKHLKAMTLIEVLVSIILFSIIIISGFYAFSAVGIGKIKLIGETDIEKESHFFSERLFTEIKKGGLIDYEEYFNRMVVNKGQNPIYLSGHYLIPTGFGNYGGNGNVGSSNYGDDFYLCRSTNIEKVNGSGCFDLQNLNNEKFDYSGIPQRYGQYALQFIDYNANMSEDYLNGTLFYGDEDSDGFIEGDDDDESVGIGPEVFTSSGKVSELYLISGDKKTRTIFRWRVGTDLDAPAGNDCDFSNPENPIGNGCLGTIEFLKLKARDWGINHDKSSTGTFDGIYDTWIVDPNLSGNNNTLAGSGTTDYRVGLFSKDINVKNVKFFLFPNKDYSLSWKEKDAVIAPYLRIQYTLTPSWDKRKGISGKIPNLEYSTTISLTDIFSKK